MLTSIPSVGNQFQYRNGFLISFETIWGVRVGRARNVWIGKVDLGPGTCLTKLSLPMNRGTKVTWTHSKCAIASCSIPRRLLY